MGELRMMLRRILSVIRKELLATLKDPKSRTIVVIPVILQTMLFGYVATYDLDEVPYAVLDQSRSKYSMELLAKLDGSGIFRRVKTLDNNSQIAGCIDTGDAMLVLTIPQDFAKKLTAGEVSPVQVITDGRSTMTSGLSSGYVASIVGAYNNQLSQRKPLIQIDTVAWYNPNLISRWGFLASLLPMMSLSQVIMLSGLSVAREREQGTFDQLLVTPLTPKEILIGKLVPPLLIGLTQVTLILMVSVFWFKMQVVGSFFTLYLTLLIFLVSCVGIGLSISAISDSMQQVIVYCFVVLMPVMLLSGMATPVRNMPEALQYFTDINPLRFAIDSVRRIYLEGAGLATIAPNFIPMILVTMVTLPTAAWLFRNKLS